MKITFGHNRSSFIFGASWVYDPSWAQRHWYIYVGFFVVTIIAAQEVEG